MFKSLPSLDKVSSRDNFSTPRIFVLRLKPSEEQDKEVALLVERDERLSQHEGVVTSASLRFHYQIISGTVLGRMREGGEFSASYECCIMGGPHVRLTSSFISEGGYCVVDPGWLAGRGIGTFFMNEIVHWARQWPEASVMPVRLLESDARGENTSRRNRFYENFGLIFEYLDDRKLAGQSAPMLAKDLTPLSEEKRLSLGVKLEWCNLDEYLSEQVREKGMLEMERWGLQNQLKSSTRDWEKAYRSPFRWAVATFVSKFVRGY
ncbi:hypothetical protein [Halomonas caseinilytica]|uniref:hypothetical protein n=1 Tax=Halomonas caseinilytica TaxID=438744 RepID=UPI000848B9FA|nr:hypothetical protein [Halomonas caseinilytica]